MRLHLVDGTYELFRAHFSGRPEHVTPSGVPAKATVGVVSSLLALLQDPDFVWMEGLIMAVWGRRASATTA